MAHIPQTTNRDIVKFQRSVSTAIKGLAAGKSHAGGEVTLTASSATTVVTDSRISSDSVITFMPITANAAAEIGAGGMYVSLRAGGTFTITHANNAQTDRDFEYAINGTGRGT